MDNWLETVQFTSSYQQWREKKTKMYNRMYWNDIIQLIFLIYIHHLFALFNASCFTQHTKWCYSLRSVTVRWCPTSLQTVFVSCWHKNIKFHHINITYMLHLRLKCPLRVRLAFDLSLREAWPSLTKQVWVSLKEPQSKEKLSVSELLIPTLSMVLSSANSWAGLLSS